MHVIVTSNVIAMEDTDAQFMDVMLEGVMEYVTLKLFVIKMGTHQNVIVIQSALVIAYLIAQMPVVTVPVIV